MKSSNLIFIVQLNFMVPSINVNGWQPIIPTKKLLGEGLRFAKEQFGLNIPNLDGNFSFVFFKVYTIIW